MISKKVFQLDQSPGIIYSFGFKLPDQPELWVIWLYSPHELALTAGFKGNIRILIHQHKYL